ncbi:MAG: PepSY-associated TM helix domain-containing protein [Acidobacteriota bacterium]
MIGTFRQSMAWLHTWAGLIFCWILYFLFVTGTLGYFDSEIDRWMKPEHTAPQHASLDHSVAVGMQRLEQEAVGADNWTIRFTNGREVPHLRVIWRGPEPEEGEERIAGNERLDLRTGEPLPEDVRETGGGQVLYRMHYSLHYLDRQAAFRFMGVVAMFMFIGLITGIITHRKIFKDLFTFHPERGRRSWLDMHNLLSVSSLPFQLMITYSGLLFTVTIWMPAIAVGSYGFDLETVADELGSLAQVQIEREGTEAVLTDVQPLLADAVALWGEDQVDGLDVRFPGDANARVILSRSPGVGVVGQQRVYDGVSGEYLETIDPTTRAPIAVASVMIGLHEGLFAGPLLRWLYFISGLLGAGMVATGAIYWTAKRKKKALPYEAQSRSYRFVESLNVGTILGLPIGIAAYFWANRLLPLGMEGRADWEIHCLFLAWALCLLYPLTRPSRVAWRELAWLAAFAFGALPIVNAATTDAHMVNSLRSGDWVLAAFDGTALAFGLIFAGLAAELGRRRAKAERAAVQTPRAVGVP